MRLYNTLSGKKEELTVPSGKLRMFVCGPTVYDESHIGHARTYLSFDIIVRYLRARGQDISYLQNITDVDDKIITRAKEAGKKDPIAFAHHYEADFLSDMNALRIASVNTYARASEYIPEIVRQVQTLRDKNFAYKIPGDGWYFDVSRFPEYGKLSGRTAAEAEDSVSRIDENIKKRNRADFCLWKFPSGSPETILTSENVSQKPHIQNGEPLWETPLGLGRPGWHIEDTAITEKFYGSQYDIHGGGVDIKFPHHEAEIAQQEAASGKKPFVRFWMHTGSLLIDGKKMSKSAGNFLTIKEFLKTYPANVLRWIALSHHYRAPLNYTAALCAQAQNEFLAIEQQIAKLEFVSEKNPAGTDTWSEKTKKAEAEIAEGMDDDFNAALSIAALNRFVGLIQPALWTLSSKDAQNLSRFLKTTLAAWGFDMELSPPSADAVQLAEERELCRTHKQFIQSDALRNRLLQLGYIVEDTPLGPFLFRSRG